MFLGISGKYRGYARVKARAQKRRQARILELVLISPLPGIVKVGGEAQILAALFVNLAPFRVFRIFRLVVCRVDIIHTGSQAGIHNGQILIGQGYIEHGIRLVFFNQLGQGLHIIGINLRRGDFRLRLPLQFFFQGIALGNRAAGNHEFIENLIILTYFMDSYAGYTAAADNH